ncbi:hypothetical protein BRADI_2g58602v3 [Brachypodium distachyon]|uniref:RNase H type-1 domain-containing protein n=1 Tax=Brachypodium distachyon TaxID=15368 RepID=A0A2K2DGP6_BRADI|nr:hypothetical protein BRADI_2g58602v3 [Brachypodium distachyon]
MNRDETGTYVGSSARIFDHLTDPPTLEVMACREALALAKDLNLQRICIASYAQVVINGLLEALGRFGCNTFGLRRPAFRRGVNNAGRCFPVAEISYHYVLVLQY